MLWYLFPFSSDILLTRALHLISLTIVSILRLQCLVILVNGHNPTSKHDTHIPPSSASHRRLYLYVTSFDAAGPRGLTHTFPPCRGPDLASNLVQRRDHSGHHHRLPPSRTAPHPPLSTEQNRSVEPSLAHEPRQPREPPNAELKGRVHGDVGERPQRQEGKQRAALGAAVRRLALRQGPQILHAGVGYRWGLERGAQPGGGLQRRVRARAKGLGGPARTRV